MTQPQQPPTTPALPSPPTGDVFQFVFTSVRGGGTTILSLSEVLLFDADGQQVSISAVLNPGGEYSEGESPLYTIDGKNQTKWLDSSFQGEAILQLQLAHPSHVVQYELVTTSGSGAAWNRKRDPTGWRFGIVRDGSTFEVLSTVTDFVPPDLRSTSYGRFYSMLPPPSLPPVPPFSPPPPSAPAPPAPPAPPQPPPVPPSPPTGDVFQFVFTSVRGGGTTILSLSEVLLFDADGEQVSISAALNPGGEFAVWESPQYAIDGNNQTKWLDSSFQGEAVLQLHLAHPSHVVQYELVTTSGAEAAFNLKRDPTGWRFGIVRDGSTFEVLSTVTGFVPPDLRSTSYGRFYSMLPPPSLPPVPPFLSPSPPSIPSPAAPPLAPPLPLLPLPSPPPPLPPKLPPLSPSPSPPPPSPRLPPSLPPFSPSPSMPPPPVPGPPSPPLVPHQPSPPAPPQQPPTPPVPPSPPTGDVFQFVFTSLRDVSTAVLSLSEVLLFDADGQQVSISSVLNPGGVYSEGESPQYAIDGNNQTKWLDSSFQGEAVLQLPPRQKW